ncbi:unnamed protein product, partial [Bubo scandiacus]
MPGVVVLLSLRPARGAGAGARSRTTTPSIPRAAPRGAQLKRVAAERTPSPPHPPAEKPQTKTKTNRPPTHHPPAAPTEPRKWRRREGAPPAGGA